MELELKKFNPGTVKSTGGKTSKMRMSEDAQGMIFQMFTETIYQEPIGSVVREIASNCFDSHIEAGTDSAKNPVIIKHSYDKLSEQHYISFFDFGVGMSPDRVENIYGVYFESSKRKDVGDVKANDQIGGFGIGGKTPLAYTESFFVITRYNGIEYTYSIYKGSESPEIHLLHEKSTKEKNGTEIRIPVMEKDIPQFNKEIRRQLYYFENIVFSGFDNDSSLNDYRLYKGKNFIYRGDTYDDKMHICLGKVAYPINYNALDLDYYDHRIPVALKFDIGELTVTPNRESIQYNDSTIKAIKSKIEIVKKELITMISKQYDNVRSLEEYYDAKNNFGYLHFKDFSSLHIGDIVDKKDVTYSNFKYKDLKSIPPQNKIIKLFYYAHEYGKRKNQSPMSCFFGETNSAIYHCRGAFKRKVIKQSYLNYLEDKNFIILKPYLDIFTDEEKYNNIRLAFGLTKPNGVDQQGVIQYENLIPATKAKKLIKQIHDDVKKWVEENFKSYDDLEIPQDFIDARKKERISKEILNTTIPLNDANYSYSRRKRVRIKNIVDFKGRIYYGIPDEEYKVATGLRMYEGLFGSDHLDSIRGYDPEFHKGKGIIFVTVAKTNLKYMKMSDNCYHIDTIYPTLLHRKMINPTNVKIATDYINRFENLHYVYKDSSFSLINKVVSKYFKKVKEEIDKLQIYNSMTDIDFNNSLVSPYMKDIKPDLKIKTERELNYLYEVEEKNRKILEWISLPYNSYTSGIDFTRYSDLVDVLKKVMVF